MPASLLNLTELYPQMYMHTTGVRKGDTLTSIARKYRTSINSLCRLNKISPKRTLRIGQPIRID